jgi:hypothetical protein
MIDIVLASSAGGPSIASKMHAGQVAQTVLNQELFSCTQLATSVSRPSAKPGAPLIASFAMSGMLRAFPIPQSNPGLFHHKPFCVPDHRHDARHAFFKLIIY